MDFNLCKDIIENVSRVVVGKKDCIELLVVALLADGHVLLEDVPGVGKTLVAKCLARSIGGRFKRVQFTPDLLPSDITGFNVYSQQTGRFKFQPGPVMTNVLLADEINRTIPRTQSSLLESMEANAHVKVVDTDDQTIPSDEQFLICKVFPDSVVTVKSETDGHGVETISVKTTEGASSLNEVLLVRSIEPEPSRKARYLSVAASRSE